MTKTCGKINHVRMKVMKYIGDGDWSLGYAFQNRSIAATCFWHMNACCMLKLQDYSVDG